MAKRGLSVIYIHPSEETIDYTKIALAASYALEEKLPICKYLGINSLQE